MRYEQPEAVKLSISRWADRGYCIEDVALMHGLSVNTVRRQGYRLGGLLFGNKRLWGAWRKALTTRPEVPDNLKAFHDKAMRFWRTGPGLPFDQLRVLLGDFNEERMQEWVRIEVARLTAERQVQAWMARAEKGL